MTDSVNSLPGYYRWKKPTQDRLAGYFRITRVQDFRKGEQMATHYNILFEGKTAPDKDIDTVKKALMNLLKIDDQSIDRLFSGRRMVIRKNVDAVTAEKFQKAFVAAGAVCSLEQIAAPGKTPTPDKQDESQLERTAPGKTPPAPPSVRSVKTADGGKMIITNIETVPGKSIIEHFGLVSGSTIRAKHVGQRFNGQP